MSRPAATAGSRRRAYRCRAAIEPWDHAPAPWVAEARLTLANRNGDWQWEPRRKQREPPMLAFDSLCSDQAPRNAHGEVPAEAVHLIVPATIYVSELERRPRWELALK